MNTPAADPRRFEGPGLGPGDRARASYYPYTAEEAPFVDEFVWATEEQILLRRRQPAEPDPLWLRAMSLAHRVLHASQRRIAAIRKERRLAGLPPLTPATAGLPAASLERFAPARPAAEAAPAAPLPERGGRNGDRLPSEAPAPVPTPRAERPSPAQPAASSPATTVHTPARPAAPAPLRASLAGSSLRRGEDALDDLLPELALVPAFDPRHLVLKKSCETLESYARLIASGVRPAELLERDFRLERRDLSVLRRALALGLHRPVDPEDLPDEISVFTEPCIVETLEIIRSTGRDYLRHAQAARRPPADAPARPEASRAAI